MDVYRAVGTTTNDVVEALFDGNQLASYATYKVVLILFWLPRFHALLLFNLLLNIWLIVDH